MSAQVLTGYPQMPAFTEQEMQAFLCHPRVARLGTMNADGTIHLAPIFFKYDRGEFILGTQEVSRRVRNIKRNPNVTLLIDDTGDPFQAVIVYGKATLEYDDVVAKRTAIFAQFGDETGARAKAEALCNKWHSVVIRIRPERLVSFDYSKADLV